MTRPLVTDCTGPRSVVVTLGEDAARQLAHHITSGPGGRRLYTRVLTGAEIHLTGEDVDAFADSTADAHEIASQDPALLDDRYDAVADAWKDQTNA